MEIYKSLKAIAKEKQINWRTCKSLLNTKIFEVQKNGKKIGFVFLDDLVLLVIEKLKGQNK